MPKTGQTRHFQGTPDTLGKCGRFVLPPKDLSNLLLYFSKNGTCNFGTRISLVKNISRFDYMYCFHNCSMSEAGNILYPALLTGSLQEALAELACKLFKARNNFDSKSVFDQNPGV